MPTRAFAGDRCPIGGGSLLTCLRNRLGRHALNFLVKFLAPVFLALAACTPAVSPQPVTEAGREDSGPAWFDAVRVETDLKTTARERFGEGYYAEAIRAPTYLFAKHYVGLAPPPIVQPDGSYKYPPPPMAMLLRDSAGWKVATATGFRQARPDKAAAIEAILVDPAFWGEPASSQPACTDAGGSLLMLRAPRRDQIVRQGACGATALTERLVFLALEA